MRASKTKALLAVVAGVATMTGGCSKIDNYQAKAIEYRQECFGDHTVKCRSMMVDVAVAQLEAGMEMIDKSKDRLVACRGQNEYDKGIVLINEKIAHYKELKPNFFMRSVLSGTEVEFEEPPFKHEPELAKFFAGLDACMKGTPGPTGDVT